MSRKRIEKNIAWDDVRDVYYVTLNFGKGVNGKYNKKSVTCSSKREAKQILREHKAKMEAGTAVPPVKDTLSDCTKDFIDYKATNLAQSTIYGYTNIWKNHIAPHFKKQRIQDVTAKDIQDYISKKSKSGLSLSSVKKHIALLHEADIELAKNQLRLEVQCCYQMIKRLTRNSALRTPSESSLTSESHTTQF